MPHRTGNFPLKCLAMRVPLYIGPAITGPSLVCHGFATTLSATDTVIHQTHFSRWISRVKARYLSMGFLPPQKEGYFRILGRDIGAVIIY